MPAQQRSPLKSSSVRGERARLRSSGEMKVSSVFFTQMFMHLVRKSRSSPPPMAWAWAASERICSIPRSVVARMGFALIQFASSKGSSPSSRQKMSQNMSSFETVPSRMRTAMVSIS